jgi:hypothetical protein
VLLDYDGRAIVRRKQYGFIRGPIEYVLAEPPPAADVELCDAIGSHTLDEPDDDDQGIITE